MHKSTKREMIGVILAAGRGNRFKPLSFYLPKPLFPVCNRPILEYQIESMKQLGIRDIYIVVGHLAHMIINHFGNGADLGVKIQYINQEKPLGIAHAVSQLEPYINRPFLMFLGDIFFVTQNLETMVDKFFDRKSGAVIAVKQEQNPEFIKRNFTVQLAEDGRIRKVIEKPRFVTNNLKGCGMYLFDLSIFDSIRQTPRTAMRDEYEITTSIQIMIDDGYPVYPAEVVAWDMNVTVPCDLLVCNKKQLEVQKQDYLLGEDSQIHPEARITNSVIGSRVTVTNPITLSDSLVFPDVEITTKDDLSDVIITNESIIKCRHHA